MITILAMMMALSLTAFDDKHMPGTDYDIRDYGAVSDTSQLSTEAIQRAIDDCAKNGVKGIVELKIGSNCAPTSTCIWRWVPRSMAVRH